MSNKVFGIMTIDVGTSSVRVSLFDLSGRIIDKRQKKVFISSKFDVGERMEDIISLMSEVVYKNENVEILSICASTLVSWVLTTKDGEVVAPGFTFTDFHEKEMNDFLLNFSKTDFYKKTGRTPSAELPLFKLMYLKENSPDIYNKAHYLLPLSGYINLYLTGNIAIDHTFAAFTGMSRITDKEWDKDILECAGVNIELLPPQLNAFDIVGGLKPDIQMKLNIGCAQVVCGTSDGSAGALGAGIFKPGSGIDVMGTTDVFYAVSDKPVFERDAKLCVHPHPLEKLWLVGGATGLTGGALDWAIKSLGMDSVGYDRINEEIQKIKPGSEGLMAVCALSGERAPRWLPDVRGCLVNLGLNHSFYHCCRAILEASAYLTKEMHNLMKNEGIDVRTVMAIGGGANSSVIMQMRSDILGCQIIEPLYKEATIRGCYALSMLSFGENIDEILINKGEKFFVPDEIALREYGRLFKHYIGFYEQYKKIKR